MMNTRKKNISRYIGKGLTKIISGILIFALVFGGYNIPVKAADALTDDTTALQSGTSDFMEFDVSPYYSFNIRGTFNDSMIKTTYSDGGYMTAIQVDSNSQTSIGGGSFQYGKVYTVNGVQVRLKAQFINNGRAVELIYELHNSNSSAVTAKIGSSADTMIGSNDYAQVSFSNKGVLMADNSSSSDTYGAQFKLLPGDCDFTTTWYGYYNDAYKNMYTQQTDTTPFSRDSGIAWSWTVGLEPGETETRNCKIAIDSIFELGDVVLTADKTRDGVNAVVPYVDSLNKTQTLYYSVDGSSEFVSWGETKNTNSSAAGQFDILIPAETDGTKWEDNSTHKITFYLDNGQMRTRRLTYSVYWPGSSSSTEADKTLKFANTYQLFADIKAPAGTEFTLQEDIQPGYFFLGWDTSADGTGTRYQAGDTYKLTDNQTLYAQWIPAVTYEVYVKCGSTSISGENIKLYKDGAYVATMYYDSSKGKYSASVIEGIYDVYIDDVDTGRDLTPSTVRTTFDCYTVYFETGSYGELASDSAVTDWTGRLKLDELPVPAKKNACYEFDYWSSTSSGTTEVTTDKIYTSSTTVYAKYKENHGSWSYSGYGGDVIEETCYCGLETNTATITAADGTYTGKEIETAAVEYSQGWQGGELEISYADNVVAGTATATISKDSALAYTDFEINKASQTAPSLIGVSESVEDKGDGSIAGLTTDMEYRGEEETVYTSVEDTSMIFPVGNYAVRYKEAANHIPSPDTMITVGTGRKLTVTLPAEQKGYSITTSKDELKWQEDVQLTLTVDTGFTLTDEFKVLVNGVAVTADETSTETVKTYTLSGVEEDLAVTVVGVSDVDMPKIKGIEDKGSYCREVSFTIVDNDLDKVYIDGVEADIEAEEYTIAGDGKTHEVKAIDKGDNIVIYSISVYENHLFEDYKVIKEDTESIIKEAACEHGCGASNKQTLSAQKDEVMIEEDPSGGTIKVEINAEEEVPVMEVAGLNIDTAKSLLEETDREKVEEGQHLVVYLQVDKLSENTIPEQEVTLTKSVADSIKPELENGMYLDLSIYKKIGDTNPTVIEHAELNDKIKVSIELPESLIAPEGKVRTYHLIYVHKGVAKELPFALEGTTLTFETREFSTYSIWYEEADASDNSAATGDMANPFAYMFLLVVSSFGIMMMYLSGKKKDRED